VNLREIAEIKRACRIGGDCFGDGRIKPEVWHDVIRRIQDTGADGIELNYGCPHGMNERGMGSAVGQYPK